MALSFTDLTLDRIQAEPASELDRLPFGLVGINRDGLVEFYSAAESTQAGLSPDKVVGRHYFEVVAPCMNNFMIAQRFEDEPVLDAVVDYVLTFRMRPQPVTLHLLQQPGHALRFIAILRRH